MIQCHINIGSIYVVHNWIVDSLIEVRTQSSGCLSVVLVIMRNIVVVLVQCVFIAAE